MKSPKPPDPGDTAAAQTATNVGSAVANQALGNVNQVTPYGSLNYNQSGATQWTDPTSGAVYSLPQYTATQTLSPQQQKLMKQTDAADYNMATLAANSSKKLGGILGKNMDLSKAPDVQVADNLQLGIGGAGKINTGSKIMSAVGDIMPGSKILSQAGDINSGKKLVSGAGDITKTYGTDFSQDRQRVEQALMARMNPQLEQERSRLSAQLANQGIGLGTEAHDRAMAQYGQRANDAQMGAILGGGQEQSRLAGLEAQRAQFQNQAQGQGFGQSLAAQQAQNAAQQQGFGQNLAAKGFQNAAQAQQYAQQMGLAGFQNAAQQQGFGQGLQSAQFKNQGLNQQYQNQQQARDAYLREQYAMRNQPINEIASLLSGSQVQQPNFMNLQGGQMPTTDVAGIYQQNYQNKLGAYQNNPMLGGLFGLGAAGISAFGSDRRLKRDVVKVGEVEGLNVYDFEYLWNEKSRGYMADEVEAVRPDAVLEFCGWQMLDYSRLPEVA